MAEGVAQYSDLPKGAKVVGFSDLPAGAQVVSGPQDPEAAALAHPPIAPVARGVLARPAMPGVASRYAGPQSVALSPEQRASRSTTIPFATEVAPALLGAASGGLTLAEEGLGPGLATLGRAAMKSAAGAEIGRLGGGALGGIFGEEGRRTGQDVGSVVGGVAGPLVGPGVFAKMPLGLGRYVLSDEEYAQAAAERKLAQRAADIKAGLRSPGRTPTPLGSPVSAPSAGAGSEVSARPTFSEENLRNIIASPILSPEQAATESIAFGSEAPLRPREGLIGRQARLGGLTSAARPARGMGMPEGFPTPFQAEQTGERYVPPGVGEEPGLAGSRFDPNAPMRGGSAGPRNVMGQLPVTSRATPTASRAAQLWEGLPTETIAPELKASLEAQAGRPLTDEEAIALDRANAEAAMSQGGKPDESTAIREQHRSKLEKKGRP